MVSELFPLFVGAILLLGLVMAPFPCWRTYRLLWRAVLFARGAWRAKLRQCWFLVKAGAAAPLWTLLWYLDELLYPEYRKCAVDPVFIIGQPRCGTTLLHRTLAADERTFFAIRHIEWRYPFISVQKLIRALGLHERLSRVNYWSNSDAGKQAAKMHPNTLVDWEEDGIFFEENHLHHFFIFLRFPYPELLPFLDSFPELPESVQRRMLSTHAKVLQKMLYLRGQEARLYLSKEVTSHNKIPSLMRMYPAARFIIIARSSGDFMPSLLALMRMSTLSKTGVDPTTIAGWQDAVTQRMREDSKRLVALSQQTIPAERQFMLAATYFMDHIDIAVAAMYKRLGLSLDEEFTAHLQRQQESQKTRQRGYDYESVALEGFEAYESFVAEIPPARAPEPQRPGRCRWVNVKVAPATHEPPLCPTRGRKARWGLRGARSARCNRGKRSSLS